MPIPQIVLVVLGGSSLGLLSMQAAQKRKANQEKARINEEVQEKITSPTEWSYSEDVYNLKSSIILQEQQKKMEENTTQIQRLRSLFREKYTKLRTQQTLFFQSLLPYKVCHESNSTASSVSTVSAATSDKQITQSQEQQNSQCSTDGMTSTSGGALKRYYGYCSQVCQQKNEEQQLLKIKEQIIPTNVSKIGMPNQGNNSSSSSLLKSSSSSSGIQQSSMLLQQILNEDNDENSQSKASKSFRNALLNYSRNFQERKTTTKRHEIVYSEYEGDQPVPALMEFMRKLENHLTIRKAVIIHYVFGQGESNSFVLGVEYNPVEEEINEIAIKNAGAKVAELKKSDSFAFECVEENPVPLGAWIESNRKHQQVLRSFIEEDLESKLSKGGVRQMKYVESFSINPVSRELVKYSVEIPFGFNESNYDLRAKRSVASDIHFHDSFKQFDKSK